MIKVTVVSIAGCSATPPTITLVWETAAALNLAVELRHMVVKTGEEAERHRHIGSPTVRINGLDIEPGARTVDRFGIT